MKDDSIIIEKLKKEDLEEFYRFVSDFLIKEYRDYPLNIRRFYRRHFFDKKKIEEYLKNSNCLLLVAKADGKIIGFLKGFIGYGGSSWINWLGIDKRFRNQGLATELLRRAEEFFKKNLCHFIQLCTENEDLVEFYRKRGWKLIGLQEKSWCGQDEYLMQKNIAEPHFELWK